VLYVFVISHLEKSMPVKIGISRRIAISDCRTPMLF